MFVTLNFGDCFTKLKEITT